MVKEMTIRATEVRRKRAIWSMMHDRQTLDDQPEWPFLEPLNLRWRSPHRSIVDPPVWRRYLFNHCLPSIATNATNSNISRLAYKRFEVVTISWDGPLQAGGAAGFSSGEVDLLRLRRIARR